MSALVLLILVIPPIQASASSLPSLNYYVVYDPVEDEGLIVVDSTINITGCEFVTIPVAIIGESAEFRLLNYTVKGDLLVDGVDYNEAGYVELLGCGSGMVSLLLSARSVFEEHGILSYSTLVDTNSLEELGAQVKIVVRVTGNYSMASEQVGNVKVYVNESEGMVEIVGYGLVFLTFHAVLEETTLTTAPTPLTSLITVKPSPHTTPLTEATKPPETLGPRESPLNSLVAGILVAVIVAAVVVFIRKRKK
ncbi:MAG: hypothetical protein QW496_05610 [Desulfurococcaceae archaeon]